MRQLLKEVFADWGPGDTILLIKAIFAIIAIGTLATMLRLALEAM